MPIVFCQGYFLFYHIVFELFQIWLVSYYIKDDHNKFETIIAIYQNKNHIYNMFIHTT